MMKTGNGQQGEEEEKKGSKSFTSGVTSIFRWVPILGPP